MKITEKLKNNWLKNTFFIIFLTAILIAIFIAINIFIQKKEMKTWDLTKENLYTLSDESINQVKNIDQEVNIYFFGYTDDATAVILAKQYKSINDKINAEAIDINLRKDLASKYGVESNESVGIIVESGERSKVLTISDFYTFDQETYKEIDVTEQKLTNAILDTTIAEKPTIYFLTGHGEYSISDYLVTLGVFIQNEVNNIKSLDILQTELPEDCKVLVIANPTKDFSEIETNKILTYINNGGKIVWLGEATINNEEKPNVNKILQQFGMSYSKGIVIEEDPNKMVLQSPELILPDITYHKITQDLSKIIVASSGKINIESDEKLQELNVTVNKLLTSSEKSFYREDLSLQTINKAEKEDYGPYTIGAEFVKKINEEKTSTLIAYSNCNFVTDKIISSGNSKAKLISIYENKDIMLNTIAYLTDRGDTIRVRKSTDSVVYTATAGQDNIVKFIIFTIPILIIITGFIVWAIRRKK